MMRQEVDKDFDDGISAAERPRTLQLTSAGISLVIEVRVSQYGSPPKVQLSISPV